MKYQQIAIDTKRDLYCAELSRYWRKSRNRERSTQAMTEHTNGTILVITRIIGAQIVHTCDPMGCQQYQQQHKVQVTTEDVESLAHSVHQMARLSVVFNNIDFSRLLPECETQYMIRYIISIRNRNVYQKFAKTAAQH